MPTCEALSWIDPDGAEYPLTGAVDREVLEGVSGRGMPPIRLTAEVVPLQPGARLRSVEHGERAVAVPMVFHGPTIADARATMRAFMPIFDPTRGVGKLRARTADGLARELRCLYSGGFEVTEGRPDRGLSPERAAQRATLVFRALDPYWYSVDPYEVTYQLLAGGTFLPIPNAVTGSFITLTASEVFSEGIIALDGDAVPRQNWPVWTITGPAEDIVLENVTTGERLDFSANGGLVLDVGDVLVIDTRPGAKTMLINDADSAYPYITSASSLFPLSASQTVQILATGATAATALALSVYTAHLAV